MKSEDEVQQLIQIEAAKHGILLLRNNSGALTDKTGRLVRYGLGNISSKFNMEFKSSDLIGIKEIVVTPEMVGSVIGVFTAVEVKKEKWKRQIKDKRENGQNNFINWVVNKGGVAGFCNSIDSFKKLIL